ncbi:MAG TPA: sulfotransferase [Stellaceae bacterium]|nr:sulfotransferase [Stellaceae bacterium]
MGIDLLARWRQPPSPEHLIAAARRRTGLSDFGDLPFERPLRHLLQACGEEAELSLFGGAAIRWDSIRFLENLLRLRDEEKRAPAILEQPIAAPLVIAGLPRSGTTFLHRLLIEDSANIAPRVWQLIHPYPAPQNRQPAADRRQQRVARQLKMFQILAPQFRRLHPIEATSPQECSEITAHIFASLRFDTTYRIPSYRGWLDGTGHLDAYRFHKRFLQHLQHQMTGVTGRWVLKCPDHIFALGALRTVYPDANLVFVHRDPVAVLASVARLTEVLRRPFSRHVDRFVVGREDSDRWLTAAELMIAAADDRRFQLPIFHVCYAELVADPAATIARLYRHFGRDLAPEVAARIRRRVAANPTGGYSRRRARLEDYGLDPSREHQRYARYMARFGVVPEPGRSSS